MRKGLLALLWLCLSGCVGSSVESQAPAPASQSGVHEPLRAAMLANLSTVLLPIVARTAGGVQSNLLRTSILTNYPRLSETPARGADRCLREARVFGAYQVLEPVLQDLETVLRRPIAIQFQKGLRDRQGREVFSVAGPQSITLNSDLVSENAEKLADPLRLTAFVAHEVIHMLSIVYESGPLGDGALVRSLSVGGACDRPATTLTLAFDAADANSERDLVDMMAHLLAAQGLTLGFFEPGAAARTAATLIFQPDTVDLGSIAAGPGTARQAMVVRNIGTVATTGTIALDLLNGGTYATASSDCSQLPADQTCSVVLTIDRAELGPFVGRAMSVQVRLTHQGIPTFGNLNFAVGDAE